MKLDAVQPPSFGAKLKLFAFGVMIGGSAPDIVKLFLYRPELFGRPFTEYCERLLRGDSAFTAGERELLAAWVSKLNSCTFCYTSHRAMAERVLGKEMVEAALTEPERSDVGEHVKAALAFITPLVTETADVNAEHARAAMARGLTQQALEEVIHLVSVFTTINTIADALGFRVPSYKTMERCAKPLLKHGYLV